jgi:hypothetical protein
MKVSAVLSDGIKQFATRGVVSDAVSIPRRIKTMGSLENSVAGMG